MQHFDIDNYEFEASTAFSRVKSDFPEIDGEFINVAVPAKALIYQGFSLGKVFQNPQDKTFSCYYHEKDSSGYLAEYCFGMDGFASERYAIDFLILQASRGGYEPPSPEIEIDLEIDMSEEESGAKPARPAFPNWQALPNGSPNENSRFREILNSLGFDGEAHCLYSKAFKEIQFTTEAYSALVESKHLPSLDS
jgi:hypothetical protein